MDRDDIKEFVREVIGPNTEMVDHPNWVGLHCPLAPWTHTAGADSSPSSGISVKDDDISIFNCYACGSKGTLGWMLRQLEKYTGDNHAKRIRSLERGEFLGGCLPEWGSKSNRIPKLIELDKDKYLDLYDPAEGHWYLEERGITDKTARNLQLLHDPSDSRGDERILFPVFGPKGQLHGFTGRAVEDDVEPRIRDYHGLSKASCLLGVHLRETTDTHIVVVEGLFDQAMMHQYGYYAVAVMHAGVTDRQLKLLLDVGLPTILMLDDDPAGHTGTEKAIEAIGNRLPVYKVKYPKGSGKDPATCTQQQVDHMMSKLVIV